jgi:ABC-type phosphate transport system substrate-binding protein
MRTIRYHIILSFFVLGMVFANSTSLQAQTAWGELYIIGNKIGITQMKAQEARNIFRANTTTWPNKIAVTIALPSPKSATSEPVARLIYGTRPTSVQKFWLSLVFQGRATPPNFFDTDQELIQFIQRTPGAIGVVSATTAIPSTVLLIPIQQ